jgi:hypothetical protein
VNDGGQPARVRPIAKQEAGVLVLELRRAAEGVLHGHGTLVVEVRVVLPREADAPEDLDGIGGDAVERVAGERLGDCRGAVVAEVRIQPAAQLGAKGDVLCGQIGMHGPWLHQLRAGLQASREGRAGGYNSICAPSSITRFGGISKYAVADGALRARNP